MVAALDRVTAARDSGRVALANADLARVGVFGHSFGGAASAQALVNEPRFQAGANLDGSMFGDPVTSGVRQPFFMMLNRMSLLERFRLERPKFLVDHDQARLHEDSLFAHSTNVYWLDVPDLEHMSFTDATLSLRTHRMATEYLRAFFGRHLRGIDSLGRPLDTVRVGTMRRRRPN